MKLIIFDMDGVLVDSEKVILKAAMKALEKYGVKSKKEDFTPFIGAGEDRFIGGVAEKYGVKYEKKMKKETYDIYLDIVNDIIKEDIEVNNTLKKLKEMGIELVLASSADKIKINANLNAAKIDKNIFSHIIGGEDVENKKPDPEIYNLAVEIAGNEKEDAIVVEDALNGVEAAKRAKIKVIGYVGSFSDKQLQEANADYVISKFDKIISIIK